MKLVASKMANVFKVRILSEPGQFEPTPLTDTPPFGCSGVNTEV
jgi:hypothetical protein